MKITWQMIVFMAVLSNFMSAGAGCVLKLEVASGPGPLKHLSHRKASVCQQLLPPENEQVFRNPGSESLGPVVKKMTKKSRKCSVITIMLIVITTL